MQKKFVKQRSGKQAEARGSQSNDIGTHLPPLGKGAAANLANRAVQANSREGEKQIHTTHTHPPLPPKKYHGVMFPMAVSCVGLRAFEKGGGSEGGVATVGEQRDVLAAGGRGFTTSLILTLTQTLKPPPQMTEQGDRLLVHTFGPPRELGY